MSNLKEIVKDILLIIIILILIIIVYIQDNRDESRVRNIETRLTKQEEKIKTMDAVIWNRIYIEDDIRQGEDR